MALGEARRLVDLVRRAEMAAALHGLAHRAAIEIDDVDEHAAKEARFLLAVEQAVLDNRVIGRVEEEVDEVRHDDFRAFFNQDFFDMVVRDGMILREDFADDADFRLPHGFVYRDVVEFLNDLFDRALELEIAAIAHDVLADVHPLAVKAHRLAFLELVRQHAVLDILQDVAENRSLDGRNQHGPRQAEAVGFLRQAVHGKYRHLAVACILECRAQHAHVVRRTAGTARLEHRDARVVGVVLARFQCREQLADDDDARIAHVIVDITQAEVDGGLVRHRRHDDLIAEILHDALDELEVNRCHLRRENRMRLLALRREMRALDRRDRVPDHRLPTRERRHERAQADAGRAEVRDLVELDHRVDAVMRFEDVAHLSRRDGVEAAAERAELDERDVRMLADELRRMIEARMVAPLVDDMELLALDGHVIDGVLRENRQMVALDHLRDAVVDFGVDMIRTADEQDGMLTRLLDALENLCAIVAHVLTILCELLVGRIDGRSDFIFRQMFVFERFHEAFRHALFVIDGQERLEKLDVLFAQDVHVAADVFGIRRDNRTVVVVFRRMLFIDHVVGFARIENLRDALLDEIHDVAVRDFRRIAERVGWHGRHALVVHLCCRLARQLHAVAEIREEREPERIVLVHVQHARNADRAALRVFERLIVAEETAVLVLVDVRRLVLVRLLAADAALAAVAREILAAVREFLHRDQALVAAALAAVRARLHVKILKFVCRKQ